MECGSKSDISNNRGDWNHLRITQTVPEQHTGKAQDQGTTENSRNGHCTQTAESANVEAHNMFNTQNNITCSIDCEYRTAATLYTVETWFASGI